MEGGLTGGRGVGGKARLNRCADEKAVGDVCDQAS